MLKKLYRITALELCCAYGDVSDDAACAIAGMIEDWQVSDEIHLLKEGGIHPGNWVCIFYISIAALKAE